jgi:peptide-methionine (S)-S-oxide reductase
MAVVDECLARRGALHAKTELVAPGGALPGHDTPIVGLGQHVVLGTVLTPPFPEGAERAISGMRCSLGS